MTQKGSKLQILASLTSIAFALTRPIAITLCVAAALFPSNARATYDLSYAKGIQLLNISDMRADYESLKIKGSTNPAISIPTSGLNPSSDYILHIETKSSSPFGLLQIHWKADGRTRFYPSMYIPLKPYPGLHAYDIDMRASKYWKGDISNLTITWKGFNDNIEIKKILLKGSTGPLDALKTELENFFVPAPMTPLTINSLDSSYIFGLSSTWFFNLLICVVFLGIFAVFMARRKHKNNFAGKARLIAAAALLFAWLALDFRTYKSEYLVYRASALGRGSVPESTHVIGDFYSFAETAKKLANKDTGYYLLSNDPDTYDLRSRYILYPVRQSPNSHSTGLILVYRRQDASIMNGKLILNNATGEEGSVLLQYGEHSFIFAPKGAVRQ